MKVHLNEVFVLSEGQLDPREQKIADEIEKDIAEYWGGDPADKWEKIDLDIPLPPKVDDATDYIGLTAIYPSGKSYHFIPVDSDGNYDRSRDDWVWHDYSSSGGDKGHWFIPGAA